MKQTESNTINNDMRYMASNLSQRLQSALKSFGDEVNHCRADNSVLPWGPMMPYVYPCYGVHMQRYFYIGRDTYGWDLGGGNGFGDFFEKYDANDLGGYLRKNCEALSTEKRVSGWSGYTGSFWYVVNMLHLRLRQGKIIDMKTLSPKMIEVLNEIGYGNLNSIELPVTLQKQECWDDIDKEKYWIIKKSAEKHIDRYDLIDDVFSPSVSIIMTWSGNESNYFRDMDYEKLADEMEGKLRMTVYLVKKDGRRSIIVWTYHPSYLPRIKVDCGCFVERIAQVVEKYQVQAYAGC